ncbi:MAG: O-antigen ligase family protein [Bacteroidota bacterium]|nr:O-antigen ligase family protein [Bacteroidota bacterium]
MSTIIVKIIVLCVIMFITFVWFLKKREIREKKEYILSLYIICLTIPLQFPLLKLANKAPTGAWGEIIYVSLWNLLLIAMLFLPKEKIFRNDNKLLKWWLFFLVAGILSIFNPVNFNLLGSLVGVYYFAWFIFSLTIIYSRFNHENIFNSLWTSFKILLLIQLLLSLAFPLLNITEATTLFYGGDALEWTTRGDRESAVGTFTHPSNLGLITSFIFVYFTSTYFLSINKKQSLLFMGIAFTIILLTKSRTNIALIFFLFFFIKMFTQKSNLKKIIFRGSLLLPIIAIIAFLLINFTEFGSNLFLTDNIQEMGVARFVHWYLGWEIFSANPLIGVGLNSHLNYLHHNIVVIPGLQDYKYEFFITNPLHNTHLIMLSEYGILGGIIWLYGFYFIIKKNLIEYNLSIISKEINPFSYIFTLAIIIIYFFYAFTGWATTQYFVISFMIIFLVHNNKIISDYQTKINPCKKSL